MVGKCVDVVPLVVPIFVGTTDSGPALSGVETGVSVCNCGTVGGR
jgi:hypothetical protein